MPAVVPAVLRLAASVLIVAAVVAQWVRSAEGPGYRFVDFFGYFTMQSNLIAAVALAVGAVFLLRRRPAPAWSVLLRGAAVTYLATTGIVYDLLLADLAMSTGTTVVWSNDVLHRWMPVFLVLDWVLVGDRGPLPWRRFGAFLVYPLVWLGVVLLRGDSFVPYPFLDVAQLGAGTVALWCLAIAGAIAALSAMVIVLSRYRLLRVTGVEPAPAPAESRS